jgi:hypothetical protein
VPLAETAMNTPRLVTLSALALSLAGPPAHAADPAQPAGVIVPRDYLILPPVGPIGRSPVRTDALEALRLTNPAPPKAGDTVPVFNGDPVAWEAARAGENGRLEHRNLRGGYASTVVTVDSDRTLLLEASGHISVRVNGEARAGDPYSNGLVRVPVRLHKGDNELLFRGARGSVQARLSPPKADALLDLRDSTLPDLIVGEPVDHYAAFLVVNATDKTLDGLAVQSPADAPLRASTPVPALPPLSVRKVRLRMFGTAPAAEGSLTVPVRLVRLAGGPVLDAADLKLRVRKPGQSYKRTFLSDIDDSVQYYAVQPADPPPGSTAAPALFLTLHGAGVEALGQADAYARKPWGHLVAPTNRRPYGFDWEDWGRWDALEVLERTRRDLHTDPLRTYLTGHSMGGHGVWQLGALFPDQFAAIGPSAGWPEFATYGGGTRPRDPSPLTDLLLRAGLPSETRSFARNYAQEGVYILHGDADDNVPVGQARLMRQLLAEFHPDLHFHEQPGAGHWWGLPGEAGVACVDWRPIFDLFSRRVIPRREAVRTVEFGTPGPGVSAWCHWAGVEAQQTAFRPSWVKLAYNPSSRTFSGTTVNIVRLALDLGHLPPGREVRVDLDGQKLDPIPWPAKGARVWLARAGEKWAAAGEPSPALKGPHRSGPFKEAFRNKVLFVYGTQGTPEENAWALAKARFDAETFWYRGNGSIDVIPDAGFDPAATADRNVVLYGHAEMNGAWPKLLADSPVQVRRGAVTVGERAEKGDDLGCLFVRPRPGSDRALVGVVAGSGLPGLRVTDLMPVFVSGGAYPDCLVVGADMLTKGAAGLRGVGFFGNDWGVPTGEFRWRE